MPDPIYPDERAAIDAAIAKGLVRKVPTGASGYAHFGPTNRTTKLRSAKAEKRRKKVVAYLYAGYTTTQLAQRFQVSNHTIRNDVRAVLGENGWEILNDNWHNAQRAAA